MGVLGFLLDTHCWVWWKSDWARIPSPVRRRLGRTGVELYLSAATAYEIAIKHRQGKLKLPKPPGAFVDELIAEGAIPLPVTTAHSVQAGLLPDHHHDPFDRLLIAQSQLDGIRLVTADPRILAYDVDVVDARK